MHTSHFGNWKKLPQDKAIAVCQGIPKWYTGRRNMRLAPSWDMVKLTDNEEYERRYAEILAKLDPWREYGLMEQLVGGGAILLCWEKDPEHCHRRMIARWFEQALGIQVSEYPVLQMELI